jgi:glycosyltransferase involved in cell wall biosynthesis
MNSKITMLVASLGHGGAEKVCLTLCNEFVQRKYYVEVWVVGEKETSLIHLLNKKVAIVELNKKKIRNSFFALTKLFISQNPNILLVFHVELALIALIIKKLLFLKTKVYIRSINTLSHSFKATKKNWRSFLMFKLIKFIFPYSEKIIAQSSGMREDLINFFGTTENKIVTIHNPSFHISSIKKIPMNSTTCENEFIFIGSFRPQKGLLNLIQSFKKAHDIKPEMCLTLIGDGEEREMIFKEVNKLGLNSCVKFEGYQENTLPYLKRAKATLLTSFFEGFPNVLVESIAVGTPVISFDLPSGPKDIIEPGINGILVPHLNTKEFTKAILSISNNEIVFNKEDIIKTAERFSLNKIVDEYERVLMKK